MAASTSAPSAYRRPPENPEGEEPPRNPPEEDPPAPREEEDGLRFQEEWLPFQAEPPACKGERLRFAEGEGEN